jgi:hypothetical protein
VGNTLTAMFESNMAFPFFMGTGWVHGYAGIKMTSRGPNAYTTVGIRKVREQIVTAGRVSKRHAASLVRLSNPLVRDLYRYVFSSATDCSISRMQRSSFRILSPSLFLPLWLYSLMLPYSRIIVREMAEIKADPTWLDPSAAYKVTNTIIIARRMLR